MNFNDRVYDIVRRVPKGKVISYGQLLQHLGAGRVAALCLLFGRQPQRRPGGRLGVAPQSISVGDWRRNTGSLPSCGQPGGPLGAGVCIWRP